MKWPLVKLFKDFSYSSRQFLTRGARIHLRSSIRGYRKLKSDNQLSLINFLRIELSQTRFEFITPENSRGLVFGLESYTAETVIRQFLILKLLNERLTQAILRAKADNRYRIVHPLPVQWRAALKQNGLKVSDLACALLWKIEILRRWIYGFACIAKYSWLSATKVWIEGTNVMGTRYAYFEGLGPTHLPKPCSDGRSHDIFTWYAQWGGRAADLEALFHSVDLRGRSPVLVRGAKVERVGDPIPLLADWLSLSAFIGWAVVAVAVTTLELIRGRWWHALLLAEASRLRAVRLLKPEQLARDYLFQTNWIYRPLWTYEAERRGSRILFFFYSTNSEGIKSSNGYKPLDYDWRNLSWSHYLVWDSYQAEFIRNASNNSPKIEIVGPVWLQSSDTALPQIKRRSIAVFDVQPFRLSKYHKFGSPIDYYIPMHCINFLRDIFDIAGEVDYQIVWKRKRNIGKHAHPTFRAFAERLVRNVNVVEVDAEVAPNRVIEATKLSISMPFTSAAIVAHYSQKPSCYYDSGGLVMQDDRGAHGLPIVVGRAALRDWITSQ